MILFYSLLILFLPFIIFVNVLIYRGIVRKALTKYIKPKLEEKGLLYIQYKWPGLFSTGDFKESGLTLTMMNKNGNISNSSYADIYYKVGGGTKKLTVRIDTTFFVVNKVIYSSEL